MNYAFTVTKHGSEELPISAISAFDYNRIWDLWFQHLGLVLLYKFQHEYSEQHIRHVHWHGCLFSPKGRLQYSTLDVAGFSIKFENPYKTNFDRWHQYCMHELNDSIKDMKTKLEEQHGRKLLKSCYEAGTKTHSKQTKIKFKKQNGLFKISITGNI